MGMGQRSLQLSPASGAEPQSLGTPRLTSLVSVHAGRTVKSSQTSSFICSATSGFVVKVCTIADSKVATGSPWLSKQDNVHSSSTVETPPMTSMQSPFLR